jgi:hypothetical protein
LAKIRHFVNLTNGIQAIKAFGLTEYDFVRIKSTDVQYGRWAKIIRDLDCNFLMWAARGYECWIYDASKKKSEPDALAWGAPWIRYVLNRYWLGLRWLEDGEGSWDERYNALRKEDLVKLDYIKQFMIAERVIIRTCITRAYADDEFDHYNDILGGRPKVEKGRIDGNGY